MVDKINQNYLNGFDGLGWSRSVETVYEEEGVRVIKAALLRLGAGAVNLDGVKATHTEVFVKVLSESQNFIGVDQRSRDEVNKVECRCRLTS